MGPGSRREGVCPSAPLEALYVWGFMLYMLELASIQQLDPCPGEPHGNIGQPDNNNNGYLLYYTADDQQMAAIMWLKLVLLCFQTPLRAWDMTITIKHNI